MDLALRESQKTDMEQYNYIDLLLPRKQGLRCKVNYALCVCIYEVWLLNNETARAEGVLEG